MNLNKLTKPSLKNSMLAIGLIALGALLRVWPLDILNNKLAWLTFYPVVTIAAAYGGFYIGLFATALSCGVITFLWFLIANQPFIANNVDVIGMLVFFINCGLISAVSESNLLSKRAAIMAIHVAEEANRAKTIFLANMSHELRTPLNSILGYSQLIEREEISPSVKEKIQIINKSGEHLLFVINQVLEVAKSDVKGSKVEENAFNLHLLVEDIKIMFSAAAQKNNIKLETSIKGLTGDIYRGDERKLKMVLINLIGNGIKFTENGEVKLVVSKVGETETGDLLKFEIIDTGAGIEEEELNKLFKYFSQTESGLSQNTGSGIGLALSKIFVEAMEGEMLVASVVGKGSTFSFQICLSLSNQCEIEKLYNEKNVVSLEPEYMGTKILVADDREENRRLLEETLTSVGFRVEMAKDGHEAAEIYEWFQPALIFMDIRMPIMDGVESLSQIMNFPEIEKCPVVAVSAHSSGVEREKYLTWGFVDFISKPFRLEEIFTAVEKYVGVEYQYSSLEKTTE